MLLYVDKSMCIISYVDVLRLSIHNWESVDVTSQFTFTSKEILIRTKSLNLLSL